MPIFRWMVPLLLSSLLHAEAAETARPVLITVDDLPIASGGLHPDAAEREKITRDLLEVFRKHQIRAVGLITWKNVRDEADLKLLELWLEAGHELGNHSSQHKSYTQTSIDEYLADIEAARVEVARFLEARGQKLRFFRFPFLREGDTPEKLQAMRDYLAKTGQQNLQVTLDNQDWSFEEPWVLARRKGDTAALQAIGEEFQTALRTEVRYHESLGDALLERVTPQILLLHANEVGTAQWDALFTWMQQTGHRFATADEVLADPVFAEKVDYVGTHGPGLWTRMDDVRRRARVDAAIRKLLVDQIAAWNRGDVEAFCSVYAEDAAFLSPSGWTQGRQAVQDRYRKRYPDAAAMGQLSLEIVELRLAGGMEPSMLGDAMPSRIHGASVAARWKLSYPDKPEASGLTLIVLRPKGQSWEIVQDASM